MLATLKTNLKKINFSVQTVVIKTQRKRRAKIFLLNKEMPCKISITYDFNQIPIKATKNQVKTNI